jgi:hypothetical protein
LWLWFKRLTFAVLTEGGFAEALALVRQRIAGNEPHVFSGKAGGTPEVRLWIMTESLWHALRGFPAAYLALEHAVRRCE